MSRAVFLALTLLASGCFGGDDASDGEPEPGGESAGTSSDSGGTTPGVDDNVAASYAGPCTEIVDFEGDGIKDLHLSYSYDDLGALYQIEDDYLLDGEPDRRRTYSYDQDGRLVLFEDNFDFPLKFDDEVDLAELYDYDREGHLIARWVDEGADGTFDDVTRYEYDDDGRLAALTVDEGVDNTPDRIEIFRYDADGALVVEEIDLDGDGSFDGRYESSYTGELIHRRELDIFEEGQQNSVDRIETWSYDERGNNLRKEWDRNNDDIADQIIDRQYDARNNLISSQRDGYDNFGFGLAPDGIPDYTRTLDYSCWPQNLGAPPVPGRGKSTAPNAAGTVPDLGAPILGAPTADEPGLEYR